MLKKVISMALSMCLLVESVPLACYAENATTSTYSISSEKDIADNDILDIASITAASPKTVNDVLAQYKFRSPKGGRGFAAERGNDLADKIRGKNTRVVGDNNLLNGPDRLIINRDGTKTFIQDKYYGDITQGINACFDGETEMFRYLDGDGNPMLIEVPSDQYADAVELMKTRIREGKVPGVTDPEEANTIVKKGALSYKQAVNLSKAGTLQSLKYDAINGTVTATSAFGISTLLNYSVNRINGVEREQAIKNAAEEGLKTGVMAFGSSVIAGQLAKTGLMKAFEPSSEALVKAFGDKFAEALVKSTGKAGVEAAAEATSQTLTKNAAKVLRSHAVVAAVEIIVFTVPDAIDLFRGRISKTQFIKNFAVTAAAVAGGVVGGVIGGAAGSAVAPGAGTAIGSVIGGTAVGFGTGWAADKIADHVTNDDAEEMYEIMEDTFVQLCDDYIVNEAEASNIVEELNSKLTEDAFKDMYQSDDREAFAEQFLTPLFEQEIAKREKMEEPTEEELRAALLEQLEGVVFIH